MERCAGGVMGRHRIPTLAKNARVGQPAVVETFSACQ